jgi:exonuclease VII large subunit
MQPAGEGLLQQKYEQLKALLAAEGLFDQQHKQALPPARCVGVITSKSGAALHDILQVLKDAIRRCRWLSIPRRFRATTRRTNRSRHRISQPSRGV